MVALNRCACSRMVTAALVALMACVQGTRKDGHETITGRFINLTPTAQDGVEKGREVSLDQVIERFGA